MATNIEDPPEQTAASLLSGILGDLQQLVVQQFQLTRREIEVEFSQRMVAGTIIGVGLSSLLVSAVMGCVAVAHLLHWLTSPSGTDPASLPLWACHAIVAIILGIAGGVLTQIGRTKFNSVEGFHNPITEILQEPRP